MIGGTVRFLVNVESLNGVESVGNLTRHRTAPVVLRSSSGYVVRYVPTVSGRPWLTLTRRFWPSWP